MLNQIVLIGRLTDDPVLKTFDTGKKLCECTLAVRRGFKNQDGKYDTDFIRFSTWEGLAASFSKFAEKGNLIAVKGRVQPYKYNLAEDRWINVNGIIAEKITYL